jgi:hypothetical protein
MVHTFGLVEGRYKPKKSCNVDTEEIVVEVVLKFIGAVGS